jgi:transcription initiation factor TFIIIB Brf1 subunit/transcription initiation factor TFIIB
MVDIDAAWAAFELVRNTQIHEEFIPENYFFCRCGGAKTFSLELPTCTTCGLQDHSYISDEQEWVGGPDENGHDMNRVGMANDTSLFSESWGYGSRMVGKNCQKLAKINFHSSMNHRDRALFHAYKEFDEICKGGLSLTDNVIHTAKIIYRKFNEEKLTRGSVRMGIKANCVLYACKENGVARSTDEIAVAFRIPVKDISRTTDIFRETTGMDIKESANPSDIISRIFPDVLCVPERQRMRTLMKLKTTCKALESMPELLGKTPKAIVSAILFIELNKMGFEPERSNIATICGVSVPTLVKIENILKNKLDE